jgi:hypothetical protein
MSEDQVARSRTSVRRKKKRKRRKRRRRRSG